MVYGGSSQYKIETVIKIDVRSILLERGTSRESHTRELALNVHADPRVPVGLGLTRCAKDDVQEVDHQSMVRL